MMEGINMDGIKDLEEGLIAKVNKACWTIATILALLDSLLCLWKGDTCNALWLSIIFLIMVDEWPRVRRKDKCRKES